MESSDMEQPGRGEGQTAAQIPVPRELLIWGSASIALAIFVVAVNESPAVLGAGFFAKGFAIIIGAVLGLIGALIGDALRKFVRPSGYFTSGGFFSLLFLKLFWIAGPQVIGLLIGVLLGVGLVLS